MPRLKTSGNHLGRRPALNYLKFSFNIHHKMVLTAVLDSKCKAHIIKTHTKMMLSLQSLLPEFCVLKILITWFQKSDCLQMEFRKQCQRGQKRKIPNWKKRLLYQAQWKPLHVMYLMQPSRRCSSSKYLESLQKKVLRAKNCRNCAALVFQDAF